MLLINYYYDQIQKSLMACWSSMAPHPLFFMLLSLPLVADNLAQKLFFALLPLAMLYSIIFLANQCNYIEVSEEEIIVQNRLLWWKVQRFCINDIVHISFDRTYTRESCIYFKVLTHNRWSKRCYLRLVSKKHLKAFAQHLDTLDIPYNKEELQKFVKY